MHLSEIEKLLYRNQYVLSPRPIDCPFHNNRRDLTTGYTLYTHKDLQVCEFSKEEFQIVLLGDLFDHEPDHKENLDILAEIADPDFNKVLHKTGRYTGRFVIFHVTPNSLMVFHDSIASRKIYHCRNEDGTWCASQPHLLASITGIKITSDSSKLKFYNSERFTQLANSNIGNTTIYDEIRQVLPNHYFIVYLNESVRYWPDEKEKKESLSVDECARLTAPMIQGYLENIHARYPVMLPVTSGKDSRTLLAATCRIRNDVYYYINKTERLAGKDKDIAVPARLFKRLGIPFNILQPCSLKVDKDFRSVYFRNNPYASESYLAIIYNYYLHFGDRVNLPGNIATGAYWFYPTRRKDVDAGLLAKLNRVDQFSYARDIYHDWLQGCKEICLRTGYHPTELFYWEERLGNWGTQILLEKDIAQNDVNPFNSRDLVRIMLSVQPDYAMELGHYPLNTAIINQLWPEVLQVRINPGFINTALGLMDNMGLLGLLYSQKFG